MSDDDKPKPHEPGRLQQMLPHQVRNPAFCLLILCLLTIATAIFAVTILGASGGEPGWSRRTWDIMIFSVYASPFAVGLAVICTVFVALARSAPEMERGDVVR